jgi:hypothetical protein
MALKGNLRDFSTTQLLNLVNLARKTGLLALNSQAGTARLYFRDGKLIHANMGSSDGRLADMLLKAGKLSAEQVRMIQTRADMRSDKQLGLALMSAGYVTQDDIVQSVKKYMLDIVYTLFGWNEGEFQFDQDTLPSDERIAVPINLENVIMEGSRRIQEGELLQNELPDLNSLALRFTDNPDARLRNVNLSVEEWRVISFISPRNTIKQIAQSNGMDDFQIRKIVYGMLQAGLVELTRPEGAARPSLAGRGAAHGRGVEKPPAVKRNVVERLINRIKRI